MQASVGLGSEAESYPPIPPAMDHTGLDANPAQALQRSRRNWWIAGIALAVAACCCLVVLAAGGIALFNLDAGLPQQQEPPALATTFPPSPTFAPTVEAPLPPTQPPAQPATQPAIPSGAQRWSETEFYDDFSSPELDWYTSSDENSQVGYENGAYAMEVKTPDYRTLVRPPVQYLTHLEFNAQVVQGANNGTFGVACYYQDFSNYYFVDFDMANQEFHFGRIDNGNWEELSEWRSFAEYPQPLLYAVDCTPGLMALYLNNQLVAETSVSLPVEPHEMWLVVMTWSDIATGGIKVLFDNMYGYKAMQ